MNLEDNILYNNFLEDYFYKDFKKDGNNCFVELIISPYCNLKCKYCYINKFQNKLFPKDIYNEENILINLEYFLSWLDKNNFRVRLDLFSGEIFAQKIGYKVIDKIYEWSKNTNNKPLEICIPTNYTFLNSKETTERVEKYIEEFNSLKIPFILSASVDGIYCEENRQYKRNIDLPLEHKDINEFYNKVFAFNSKYKYGFHPMIYSNKIDLWKKNFLWFQNKLEEYNIPWSDIYLLQVRNVEWTDEQIKEFYDFIYWLNDWLYNKIGETKYLENILGIAEERTNFNILSQPFTNGMNKSKGLSCSLQPSLSIRLADLKVHPCHRLMYPKFEIGQYDKDFTFKTKNASLGLSVYGVNSTRMQPICYDCNINHLCAGQCLGAQYEVNDSLFVPIQSVCKLNHSLLIAILDFCKDKNLLDNLINKFDTIQKEQAKRIMNLD